MRCDIRRDIRRDSLRIPRGAMHSGKKWRSALWLNAMHSGKK